MEKGYVQVYTGNGKGKTTAALGLIVRAQGAGLSVYMGQFLKNGDYSEIETLRSRFSDITVEQYGEGSFIKGKPSQEDIAYAQSGLEKIRSAMLSGDYDIIIADEANVAASLGLFPVEHLISLIKEKPRNIELVFTGRDADQKLIDQADLVTEMRKIKHYFDSKVSSRKGIEL